MSAVPTFVPPAKAPAKVQKAAKEAQAAGDKARQDAADAAELAALQNENMSFIDSLTGTANDIADVYTKIKGEPAPPKPAAPVAKPKDNTLTFVAIGGGVLVLILVLVFALKK